MLTPLTGARHRGIKVVEVVVLFAILAIERENRLEIGLADQLKRDGDLLSWDRGSSFRRLLALFVFLLRG